MELGDDLDGRGGGDEGYEEFLALLSSSRPVEEPSRTLTRSITPPSAERQLRVSFVTQNLDDNHHSMDDCGVENGAIEKEEEEDSFNGSNTTSLSSTATESGNDDNINDSVDEESCDVQVEESRLEKNAADMLYDSPLLGEMDEENEVNTTEEVDSNKNERSTLGIQEDESGQPIAPINRSASCPDSEVTPLLSPEPCVPRRQSLETCVTREEEKSEDSLPTTRVKGTLRSSLRQSRHSYVPSQSWRDDSFASSNNQTTPPTSLSDESRQTMNMERKIPPAPRPRLSRLRSSFRQSFRADRDSLSQSWHPSTLVGHDESVPPTISRQEGPRRRPSLLRKQASTLSLLKPRPQRVPNFRLKEHRMPLDEVQIMDDEKEHPSRKKFRWWHIVFLFSLASLVICLLQLFLPPPFGLMITSAEVAEGGIAPGCADDLEHCICPRETVCATDKLSIILLTLGRTSAFFDYPLYMMVFLSKAHNLNNHMRRTLFREWIDFGDMHTVHKIFGIVIGIETMFHSFFHLLRWRLNNEMSLLWNTATGITGLIAGVVTPLICWPMIIPYLKQRISFEVRKGLHYLFVFWAIALLYHAPSKIPYLIGIPALVYAVDFIFGYMKRNDLVETAYFERYGENGVAVHFKNPKSWEDKPPTSYVYIMCPWLSKYEWHAFTMFPEQSKDNHSMLCIGASGDWTKKLHEKIKVPCLRQLYVHGPFMTEFSDQAITTSNAIAVATGVGITPTLSLMMRYVGRKRVNILWVCRDPGLIEYILHQIDIRKITKNSFAFIFYTGKRELALPKELPVNLFIFRSRPNLENTITGIITAIHSGQGLPEHLYEKQKQISNVPFRQRMMIAMSRVTQTYDEDEMFDYAVKETENAAEKMQNMDLESGHSLDPTSDSHSDSDSESARLFSRSRSSRSRHLADIPEEQISLLGLDAMISRFLGVIGEYSLDDIKDIFDTIDRNRSGFIDRSDFSAFLNMATGENNVRERRSSSYLLSSMVELTDMETALTCSMHNSLRGASSHRVTNNSPVSVFGDSNTEEYVRKLMNESVRSGEKPLEEWSIFYCGGSNAIKKDLKDISKRYDIGLAVEKFDW